MTREVNLISSIHKLSAQILLNLANLSTVDVNNLQYGFSQKVSYIRRSNLAPKLVYDFKAYNTEDIIEHLKSNYFLYLNHKSVFVNPKYCSDDQLKAGTLALKDLIHKSISEQNFIFNSINIITADTLSILKSVQEFFISLVTDPKNTPIHLQSLKDFFNKGLNAKFIGKGPLLRDTKLQETVQSLINVIKSLDEATLEIPQFDIDQLLLGLSMIDTLQHGFTSDIPKLFRQPTLMDSSRTSFRTIEYAYKDLKYKKIFILPLGYKTSQVFNIFYAQLEMILRDQRDFKNEFIRFLNFNFYALYTLSKTLTQQYKSTQPLNEDYLEDSYKFWLRITKGIDVDQVHIAMYWSFLFLKNSKAA